MNAVHDVAKSQKGNEIRCENNSAQLRGTNNSKIITQLDRSTTAAGNDFPLAKHFIPPSSGGMVFILLLLYKLSVTWPLLYGYNKTTLSKVVHRFCVTKRCLTTSTAK